jgi:sulfopyruvate decarboxylase TPP-binding subunit
VSSGVRTDTRSRLEQRGVDINSLESDFVTYQAIRSYLKDWRGAEYQTISDEAKIQKDLESIQRLMSRTTSVTEERIEKLRETDRIALDAFEVLLDVQVLCQACGDQHSVTELLERDGCPCQISSND